MTFLTIGLPVYNAMPFLPETMESLLSQSYSNFNVLVIDDGSTDQSYDYLKSVKDSRVHVLRQENMGLSFTLNRMLREVDTPWLVRQDADDIAYPNRNKLIIEYIDKYPDAGMFYTHATYYHNGRHFARFRTTTGSPTLLRNISKSGYLLAICHPSVILNVEKTISIGGYRFNHLIEDIDLWWRMALYYDILFIPYFTVSVRHNINSLSHDALTSQVLNTLYVQYLLLSHLWRNEPLPYDDITGILAEMVDAKTLRFRHNLRVASASAENGAYFSASFYLLKSMFVSPVTFYKRVSYEFSNNKIVTNGVDPKKFAEIGAALWRR